MPGLNVSIIPRFVKLIHSTTIVLCLKLLFTTLPGDIFVFSLSSSTIRMHKVLFSLLLLILHHYWQMDKVKAKARAWEAEFQRTCQPKKPVCIGCVWVSDGGGEGGEGRRREEEAFLSQFSALVLTETPVRVKPIASVTTSPPETHSTC